MSDATKRDTRPLYPLRFEAHFKEYLWGGRRLGELLGKPIGAGATYAESWEVVDHGADQSVVRSGALAGQTLAAIRQLAGEALFGMHHPQPVFPLLFKYLDARQNLSLQVHPADAYAQRMTPPDLGKTEAWVVVEADAESVIYAGVKRGFDRQAFARELQRGTGHLCVHQISPRPGDCLFIPAGVVHALGAGLLIAEIQQASNTTFRLFDWHRVGPDGQPRPLHLEPGLEVTDFQRGPIEPQTPQPTERPHVQRLVACEKFLLDRWRFQGNQVLDSERRFHILSVQSGEVRVAGDPENQPLRRGETILVPACCHAAELESTEEAVVLDMYLPAVEDDGQLRHPFG